MSDRPAFFDDPICSMCGDPQSRHVGAEMDGNDDCNVASCDCRGFQEIHRPAYEEMLQRLTLADSVTLPAENARMLCLYAIDLERRLQALERDVERWKTWYYLAEESVCSCSLPDNIVCSWHKDNPGAPDAEVFRMSDEIDSLKEQCTKLHRCRGVKEEERNDR